MEARRASVAEGVHQEDVIQPAEATEAESEVSVVPPPTKPNVVLTEAKPSTIVPTTTEVPSSSPTAPSANAAGGHNRVRIEIVSLCKR